MGLFACSSSTAPTDPLCNPAFLVLLQAEAMGELHSGKLDWVLEGVCPAV